MPATGAMLLIGKGLFLVGVYVAAGWLVLRRVRERWDRSHRILAAVVLGFWPAVVLGVAIGWLLGLNAWHVRPDR